MSTLALPNALPGLPNLAPPLIRELKGWPVLGAGHLIRRDPLNFLSELTNRADNVISLTHLGQRVFIINSPAGVEHVLEKNHKNYRKGNFYNKVKPVFGKGLPVLEQGEWKRHRQLMQPSFRKQEINRISQLSVQFARDLLEQWEAQEGQIIDLDSAMARLTLDVVATALFGSDIKKYADQVAQAIDDILSIAEQRIWAAPDLYWNWLSPYYWRFKRARNLLDRVIFEFVERRKRGETLGSDLLEILVLAAESHSGTHITDRELRDEITTLLVTGHESTANSLTWMFYSLAQHADVKEKMAGELFAQLGDRDPQPDDFDRLPYTKAVVQEILRLYPAAWSLSRANYADDEIEGVAIPAGSNVMISPYLMHRHRRYFHNPEAFRPERFLNGEVANLAKYTYFPFAGGPRRCIGEGFAWQEIMSIACVLARKVDFQLAPGQKVEMLARIAIKPAHGMRMVPIMKAA